MERSGTYPNHELKDQLRRGIVVTTGICTNSHKTVHAVAAGRHRYKMPDDAMETFRVEEGDCMYGYVVAEDSTMTANPNILFRTLDGMDGSIRVAFRGLAMKNYLPNKETDDGINPTRDLAIQISGTGTFPYNGDQPALKWTSIYARQMPSDTAMAIEAPRRQKQRRGVRSHLPVHVPVSHLRSDGSTCDYFVEQIQAVVNGIIGDRDKKTAGAQAKQLVDTVEKEVISSKKGEAIRDHLQRAGYSIVGGSRKRGREDQELGQRFVEDFASFCNDLVEQGRAQQDPSLVIGELMKFYAYVTYVITENRLRISADYGNFAFLNLELFTEMQRMLLMLYDDEVFFREYMYIGMLLEGVKGPTVNVAIKLNG
jgi:hypothetical protein